MTTSHPQRSTLRSVGAVVAGLATIFILSIATDAVLHATGVFPTIGEVMSDPLFLLSLAYRIIYGIAGSYVTAVVAPARPLAHAMVLGAVGLVLSTAGAMAMWDAAPAWFSLAIIAIALPCAWAGGMLRLVQISGQRA